MPSKSGRPPDLSAATRLIHAGHDTGPAARTVGPPVQKGSTILMPDAASLYDDVRQLTYGRQGLSAQFALIDALKTLENARAVTLYPSGLSALTGAMLAVLKAGDEVLVTDVIYKPTRRFCDHVLKRFGVKVRYFAPRQDPETLVGEASDATRLILMESPGSLSFEMQDLGRVAELARGRNILTIADNTWGAGYLMKPLDLGVDISVQALTKYVGGHSDVFMGSAAVNDPKLVRAMEDGIINLGWAVTGEDAYQMLRGLRTLPTRLARHGESALTVARWLAQRPEVVQVFHPALPGSPDHALWARNFSGSSGLFAFSLQPAPQAAVHAFLDALSLFGLGFSWGGFESLAIHCDPQLKVRAFHPDYGGPLIRLHIGLEDPADLIGDLERGLAAYAAVQS